VRPEELDKEKTFIDQEAEKVARAQRKGSTATIKMLNSVS
jgi:hypothetical protein